MRQNLAVTLAFFLTTQAANAGEVFCKDADLFKSLSVAHKYDYGLLFFLCWVS